jgi:hypothetical protein
MVVMLACGARAGFAGDSWDKHGAFFSSRLGVGLASAIAIAGAGYLLTVLIVGVSRGQAHRIRQAKARRAVIY